MQSSDSIVVVLGTGGTIAGTASTPTDNVGYTSAQLGAEQLVAAVPALRGSPIEVHQISQIDSKDMRFDILRSLAEAASLHLARSEVSGVVITHGTDTLEETAYFLQRVLAPSKPVVLVGAMRPSTAVQADGPQNLLDAVLVARTSGARGVVAVLAGVVHGAFDVRKVHPYRLDAFSSGENGAIAHVAQGGLQQHRDWPTGEGLGMARLPSDASTWPWVEIITSNAGATGAAVRALQAAGVRGIVVAGTGNASIHESIEAALLEAQDAGVTVLRCSRCLDGRIVEAQSVSDVSDEHAGPAERSVPIEQFRGASQQLQRIRSAPGSTPVQVRMELILRLLATC